MGLFEKPNALVSGPNQKKTLLHRLPKTLARQLTQVRREICSATRRLTSELYQTDLPAGTGMVDLEAIGLHP